MKIRRSMRKIIVVEFQEKWNEQYRLEAARLVPVFGESLKEIYHVGSTSVPGLSAKPTIDILAVIEKTIPIEDFYPGMQALGYECKGECLDAIVPGTPGRHYFRIIVNGKHTVHLHACHQGHQQIPKLLALRDYLRCHKAEAAAYGKLKKHLAKKYRDDNVKYMHGKDAMVQELLLKAMIWRDLTMRTSEKQ